MDISADALGRQSPGAPPESGSPEGGDGLSGSSARKKQQQEHHRQQQQRARLACTYTASYFRGRPPALVSSSEAPSRLQDSSPITQRPSQAAVSFSPILPGIPAAPRVQSPRLGQASLSLEATSNDDPETSVEPLSRASPEPTQTDLEGHYVGPSSGVSFLLRMQKRLQGSQTFSQGTPIFNFGDAPLSRNNIVSGVGQDQQPPYLNPSFYLSLTREHTKKLLERYFDFAVPMDRFLHRPTVEHWLEEFYDTMGAMNDPVEAPTRTAVLFMMFAVAQQHMAPRPSEQSIEMSLRYYLAATYQLSREQGAVRLASVQARLCQCLWLLSESRINHCWSLFGTVARLAVAIGLHRNRHVDAFSQDQVQAECRRRTFWSAYSLDNYLSTALGRPRTFHDDDIDQQLPSAIDDNIFGLRGQSVMLGVVAYAQLSQIVSGILRDLYSIKARSAQDRFSMTEKYTKELRSWRSGMAHFLETDRSHAAPLVPIFSRQRNALNLAYWHTFILTHRPLLLNNFAKLNSRRRKEASIEETTTKAKTDHSIRECLDAAMHVVETINHIIIAGQLFRAYWFTPYFAFSASVILYIYAIQQSSEPPETYMQYLTAAERCQAQITDIAEEGSLTSRYCLVLEELRTEARRQTSRSQRGLKRQRESDGMDQQTEGFMPAETGDIQGFGGIDFNVSPTASLADMTSWEQFDSMVMSGIPGFEAMFGGDGFAGTQMMP
ncbi:fungal-specific transcription factor domain-containing protein [Plectosphaerella plurivora]|uniref:Fungal-specific transcription factor domain-containing protein n=1 Tax=Plectosphaerella plurivora TaxID=936078 RepID=A0A9P9A7F1_9PEZI|nr:fungal-specific transcription factor domain-containing protein [Plectosphaerella plurivora]